jgi:hypothetical protein
MQRENFVLGLCEEADMASYTFRYLDESGGMIRLTAMQCTSDEDAVLQACKTMREPFSRLEIWQDDTLIVQGPITSNDASPDILRVA